MTRREEILQHARERGCIEGTAEYYGFLQGAEWADAHQLSPWISVEDRLPEGEDNPDEYNAPHRARSSRNVVITDGVIVNRGYYSYARMRWEWNGNEIKVTHWMPISKIPKEDKK